MQLAAAPLRLDLFLGIQLALLGAADVLREVDLLAFAYRLDMWIVVSQRAVYRQEITFH